MTSRPMRVLTYSREKLLESKPPGWGDGKTDDELEIEELARLLALAQDQNFGAMGALRRQVADLTQEIERSTQQVAFLLKQRDNPVSVEKW